MSARAYHLSSSTVEITLPDQLAQEAHRAGLLTPEAIERMVRTHLRAERVEKLKQARHTLAVDPLPPRTPEEIQAEIDAYRPDRDVARPQPLELAGDARKTFCTEVCTDHDSGVLKQSSRNPITQAPEASWPLSQLLTPSAIAAAMLESKRP